MHRVQDSHMIQTKDKGDVGTTSAVRCNVCYKAVTMMDGAVGVVC